MKTLALGSLVLTTLTLLSSNALASDIVSYGPLYGDCSGFVEVECDYYTLNCETPTSCYRVHHFCDVKVGSLCWTA